MSYLLVASLFYQQGLSYLSPLLLGLIYKMTAVILSKKKVVFPISLFLILFLPLFISFPSLFINIFTDFELTALSLKTLLHQFFYLVLSMIVASSVNDLPAKKVFYGIGLFILFLCVIQFIQYKLDITVWYLAPTHPSFEGSMGSFLGYSAQGLEFRSTGPFSEPGDVSMLLSALSLLYWNMLSKKEKIILTVILLLILLTNKSLSGYLALVATLFVMNFKQLLSLKFIFIGVSGLWLGIYLFFERFLALVEMRDPSFNLRLLSIQGGLDRLFESTIHFIFGYGTGNSAKMDIGDASIKSDYVRIFFESGVLGFVIYLLFIIYVLKQFKQLRIFQYLFVYFLFLGLMADTQALHYKYLFLSLAWTISYKYNKENV